MSTTTTLYTAHLGCLATVAASRIEPLLKPDAQRDLGIGDVADGGRIYNHLLDIPISNSDVERWASLLSRVAPPLRPPKLFLEVATDGEQKKSHEACQSNFLTAAAVFALPSLQERRDAIHHLAPFPPFSPQAVASLPMTVVLKLRRKWLPYRQQFPVYQQRMALFDSVLNHDFVAVVGSSGSGRTLQVPMVLSEKDVFSRRRIIVVSANEIAAEMVVARLREERGEAEDSKTVAHVLPGQPSQATEGTSVLVTIAEVFLRQILCDPTLVDVGCVVLDDMHLRTEAAELCCAMLRERVVCERRAAGEEPGEGSSGFKKLHVVLNCPDEICATSLVEYFSAAPSCRATILNLSLSALPPASSPAAAVLYLDETIQWLYKCRTEGSTFCRDPAAELTSYAEDVNVVTQVLAAADADFANEGKCRDYWCSFIAHALWHFDCAARMALTPGLGSSLGEDAARPSSVGLAVVIAPGAHWAKVIHQEVCRQLYRLCKGERVADSDGIFSERFEFCLLSDGAASLQGFLQIAQQRHPVQQQQTMGGLFYKRLVLVTTPELALTALSPDLFIGLVVDCARCHSRSFDIGSLCDRESTEYASVHALRYRRAIARRGASTPASVAPGAEEEPCMVVQLIPKAVLHSAQHRRQSVDPGQHIVFRLCFERYVHVYQVLQAREEALALLQDKVSPEHTQHAARPGPSVPVSSGSVALSAKVASLASSCFIGTPVASANRYEYLRRVFAIVESYLAAAGHIEFPRLFQAPGHSSTAAERQGGLSTAAPAVRLKALGILSTCFALPTAVVRLLAVSSIFGCTVEATAVAAMWLTGDAFQVAAECLACSVGVNALSDSQEVGVGVDREAEHRALLKEARSFFSWGSMSDVVSSFNVYKMWLGLRCGDGAEDVAEKEDAFLSECKVPRDFLHETLRIHANLHEMLHKQLLRRHTGATDETRTTKEGRVSQAIAQLAEDAITHGCVQACLTAALYPNCVLMKHCKSAANGGDDCFVGILMDGGAPPQLHGGNNQPLAHASHLSVFSDYSLLASTPEPDADAHSVAIGAGGDEQLVRRQVADRPFMFLSKTLLEPVGRQFASAAQTSASVVILEQAVPMLEEAAVVFCGGIQETPRAALTRCRGWGPVLTAAWRHTRLARLLPPPAQLPPVSIPLQLYDTIRVPFLTLTTDCNFHFTLRATTARWLHQLREHIQQHLHALTTAQDWCETGARASASEVTAAWEWWMRRQRGGSQWLREERQTRAASDQAAPPKLYGFYVFSTQPALPEKVAVPAAVTTAAGRPDDASAAEAAAAMAQPPAYTGRLPSADVDQIVRMCVRSVASKRTREHEAQLLRDNPELFSFLDAENDFHEYYLYLLRQAAPDMEVLGDNLDELVEYLTALECELRDELGLPPLGADQAITSNPQPTDGGGAVEGADTHEEDKNGSVDTPQPQLHEIAGNEEEEEAFTSAAGLQMETAAVNLRKPIAPTINSRAHPSSTHQATNAPTPLSTTVDPSSVDFANKNEVSTTSASVGVGVAVTAAATAAPVLQPPPVSVSSNTLLEKLMAMKANSAKASGATSDGPSSGVAVTADSAQLGSVEAHGAPANNAANLNMDKAFPPVPPTAAELMALLGGGGCGVEVGAGVPVLEDDLHTSNPMSLPPPGVLVNPLSKPPPPLPVKVVDERKPSVLVYPLPDRRYGNVPLMLAKALGETMGIRVGPTTIVGNVGRIDVPNKKVEARAISLRKFMCVGKKVYILKNDRIVDNPDSTVYERRRRGGRGDADGRGAGMHGNWSSGAAPHPDDNEQQNFSPQGGETENVFYNYENADRPREEAELDPTMVEHAYLDSFPVPHLPEMAAYLDGTEARASGRNSVEDTQTIRPTVRIGAFSDSEDDEESKRADANSKGGSRER